MKSYLCNNHFPGGFSSGFTSKTKTTQSNWPTAFKFTQYAKHVTFLLLLPCKHVSVCTCIISIPNKQKLSRSLLMRQWQQNCHFCLCFNVFFDHAHMRVHSVVWILTVSPRGPFLLCGFSMFRFLGCVSFQYQLQIEIIKLLVKKYYKKK